MASSSHSQYLLFHAGDVNHLDTGILQFSSSLVYAHEGLRLADTYIHFRDCLLAMLVAQLQDSVYARQISCGSFVAWLHRSI